MDVSSSTRFFRKLISINNKVCICIPDRLDSVAMHEQRFFNLRRMQTCRVLAFKFCAGNGRGQCYHLRVDSFQENDSFFQKLPDLTRFKKLAM